jgi:hypothetical protein
MRVEVRSSTLPRPWCAREGLTRQRVAHRCEQPEQIQVINPVLILIIVPLLDRVVYPALARRQV